MENRRFNIVEHQMLSTKMARIVDGDKMKSIAMRAVLTFTGDNLYNAILNEEQELSDTYGSYLPKTWCILGEAGIGRTKKFEDLAYEIASFYPKRRLIMPINESGVRVERIEDFIMKRGENDAPDIFIIENIKYAEASMLLDLKRKAGDKGNFIIIGSAQIPKIHDKSILSNVKFSLSHDKLKLIENIDVCVAMSSEEIAVLKHRIKNISNTILSESLNSIVYVNTESMIYPTVYAIAARLATRMINACGTLCI